MAADLSNVAPELVQHLRNLKRESQNNPTPPGWDAARARAEQVFPLRWGDNDEIFNISDHIIKSDNQDLILRIYTPKMSHGTMLFFHGGGWVNGSVYTHDGSCILLANLANITIISVNYRKAPQNPFPAGLNDGLTALNWLYAKGSEWGLNLTNVMVGGESSGGNIAAVVARHAADMGLKLQGQMLIYPVTDGRMNSQSYQDFNHGYMISAADLASCYKAYMPNEADILNPDISPLLADNLSDLCPTFIATCDHDPLRDDGRAYAAKLIQAGVDVSFVEMQNSLHGIWIMKAITPLAEILVNKAANWAISQRQIT